MLSSARPASRSFDTNACLSVSQLTPFTGQRHATPRHATPRHASYKVPAALTSLTFSLCALLPLRLHSASACSALCERLSKQDQRTDATIHARLTLGRQSTISHPPEHSAPAASCTVSLSVADHLCTCALGCMLSQLSSTLLNDEESISLLDYIVRQVYVEDLPDDPYATSPSAPSMLSGMPALTLAASTTFPPLTSPPHPLHLPTYNLLSSTLTHLHTTTTTTSPSSSTTAASAASPAVSAIASQRVLRGLRQFVADWKYSERKLGLKEVGGEQAEEEDGEEAEVEGMGDWLADAEDGEEGEVETMSMADFLGAPEDEAVREAEEEDEDEDEAQGGRTEHRIDVRREAAAEKKDHGATVLRSQEAKLADDDLGDDEDDAEDELDEVRLDDLGLDENDDENDGIGLDLHSSPTRATR